MRCNNCGWDNAPNKVNCEKCNYHIEGSLNADNSHFSPSPNSNDSSSNLSKTIVGSPSILPSWDTPNNGGNGRGGNTPRFDSEDMQTRRPTPPPVPPTPPPASAPRASSPKPEKPAVSPEEKVPAAQSDPFQNRAKQQKFTSTIDPSRLKVFNKSFKLQPVQKEGENPQPELVFTDDEVSLNRKNTDQDNFSITSKTQAILENKNGQWHITDKSELQTTFLQVKESTPIKDGDIILLGNRKFIFLED